MFSGGKFELTVSLEEFKRIKRRAKDLGKNPELEMLEETLMALRYMYLKERTTELKKKLEEMQEHYRSLLEFKERAERDKEYLMGVRLELSRENRELEEEVGK